MNKKFKAWVTDEQGVVNKVKVYVEKSSTAFVVVGAGVVATTGTALAGIDFTDVAISTTDIFIFGGIILAAIGSIWGIKKLIGMGNKS